MLESSVFHRPRQTLTLMIALPSTCILPVDGARYALRALKNLIKTFFQIDFSLISIRVKQNHQSNRQNENSCTFTWSCCCWQRR